MLFTILTPSAPSQVALLSLDTGEHTVLVEGTSARVVSTGHLLLMRDDTLWAAPFDAGRHELTGEPVPVVEGVQRTSDGHVARMAVSDDGTLVYLSGDAAVEPRRTLVWVDREGRETPINVPVRAYRYARISPDGTLLALDVRDEQNDIHVSRSSARS